MSNPKSFKRWIAMLLCLIMTLSMVIPATASGMYSPNGTNPADRNLEAIHKEQLGEELNPNEVVRVSIVLEKASTLEAGYSTIEIANNTNAMNYRDSLRAEQATVQTAIERKLNKELDVVWNLTLAANLISANVRRGDIAAIKSVPGVESVYVEKQYSPDVVSVGGTADPDMAIAGMIDGAQNTWLEGYTGEGALIAIIDTGLDINHQSFDNGAFLHAVDPANLALDEETVKNLAGKLNAVLSEKATADQLYRNEKVPFAWNYIDSNAEITHDNDTAGEHGSHVAGIAAANRYVDTDGDGIYEDAIKTVQVAGNAPDAQLLIMKVFGKAGGAYDSDCAAAIEDAIYLGADAVNLSLGVATPGLSDPQNGSPYAKIQDLLVGGDTVVVFSAGNAGSWADNTAMGYLYNDGVSYQFDGEPGSYTNSFTVASVDNNGFIGATFTVDGNEYGFNETSGYKNPPFGATLDPNGKGTEYKFVMVEASAAGKDDEFLAALPAGTIDKNTIYITWRGVTSFYVKGDAGYNAGAAAVIVGNNQAGTINMDLTDYSGDIPVVSTLQANAQEIWASVANKQTAGGYQYIIGTMTVNGASSAHAYNNGYYTMSSFSSWGTTSNLALKPEISAFGGSIYSVWGSNKSTDSPQSAHDQYELMSGTSMAAPQVTGMSALVQQYLRDKEYDLGDNSPRAITQGLLMATAEPMKDEDGNYYSLLQQGSGLANVLNAVSSPVYITVKGQNDGKVKAELGDNISRDGKYVVEFDIHNFTGNAYDYTVSAEAFTQAYFEESGYKFLDYATRGLDATVDASIGEADAQGTVHVTVTIQLTAAEIEKLNKENPAGAYVEAFVFVQPAAKSDGALAPKLSIPVLAYHGNWTDASMFEVGSAEDWYNRTSNGLVGGRYPYTYNGAYSATYNLTMTNVLYTGTASTSINKSAVLLNGADAGLDMGTMAYRFTPIRNYGNGVVQITDNNGNVLWRSEDLGANHGVTYYENAGFWVKPDVSGSLYYALFTDVTVDWAAAMKKAGSGVSEITVSLILAPEYYARYNYNWDALTDKNPANGELGNGAILSTTLKLDQDAPVIESITVNGDDPATRTIEVKLTDNKELSSAKLYDESGNTANFTAAVRQKGYEEKTLSGTSATATFNGGDAGSTTGYLYDSIYRLEVTDASGNVTTQRIEVGEVKFTDVPETVTPSTDAIEIVNGTTYALSAVVGPYNLTDEAKAVTWSSSDETIATVDANGVVTAVNRGNATITVSTVNNGANGAPVTAEISVEVFTLPLLATGVLGDESGYAKFFEWDFEEGILAYSDAEESETIYPQAVANYEDGTYFTVDGDGTMYVLDSEGNELSSASGVYDGMLPYDMDYTEEAGFWWTMSGWLMSEDDPMDPQTKGFNLSSYGTFIGLAIDDSSSFDTTYQGSAVHVERTIYLLTTDNQIIEIYLYNGGENALISTNETDIPATWVGYNGESYSNMVLGTDGYLYASIMTGDTNEVYQLTYWEEQNSAGEWEWGYTALYLGNFGDGVWPGLFLTVGNKPTGIKYDFDNDGDTDVDDAQVLLRAVVRNTATEDMDVNKDGKVTTRDVYDLLVMLQNDDIHAVKAPAAAKMASAATVTTTEATALKALNSGINPNSVVSDEADVNTLTHTVVVPVKASDVNNGLFELNYDVDVLTYSGNTTIDSALTHVYNKNDIVRIGFAGLEKLADDTVVAEIAFTYEADVDDRDLTITLSVIEDGEDYNDTPVSEPVDVTLPGEAMHSYTLTGVMLDGNSFGTQNFTWNTSKGIDVDNTIGSFIYPVTIASVSDSEYYFINYDVFNSDYDKYDMYLVNKDTGEILDIVENWGTVVSETEGDVIPWSMAYGGDDFHGMWGTYGYFIFTGLETDTPMADQSPSGWNLSDYNYPYFLGITIVEEAWKSSTASGDKYALIIDDSGYIWKWMPYATANGLSASFQRIPYTGMPDLYGDLMKATPDATGTSLVRGDDGALYFSYLDENSETFKIYRLALNAAGTQYVGELIAETDQAFSLLLLDAKVNHAWKPAFTWSDDHTSATVSFICPLDGTTTETFDADVTSEVTTPATCEENGITTYTASYEFEGKTYTDVIELDNIPAIGHDWNIPTFTLSEDGKQAWATFVCKNDNTHKAVVEATVTSEVTEPATEETKGKTTYTIVAEFEGTVYTAIIELTDIPTLDHVWSDPVFTWSEDYTSATATFTCLLNGEHVTLFEDLAVTSEVTTPATCETAGITTYTATVVFNGVTYTGTTEVENIPALGHDWSAPVFEWVEDGSAATVTFTCGNDETHVVTLDADITSEVTTPATCEEVGTTTYTATVTFNGTVYTDTLDVDNLPALGHIWSSSEFTWAEDHSSATVTFICERDGEHTYPVEATVTSTVKTPATCEAAGITVYTATATFEGHTYTSIVEVKDIPVLDHDWSAPEFIWSADGSVAFVKFTCGFNSKHVAMLEATVTSEVTVDATCGTDGCTTYTATVEFNGTTYTDTLVVMDVSAIGHNWSEPVFTWSEDGKTATVTFTCANDSEHTITKNAIMSSVVTVPATCEAAGTTTYTATVEFNGVTYTATNAVDDIPATGHNWTLSEITWADDFQSATATFICENDSEHTATAEATVSGTVKTPATCEEDGTTTYTATVTFGGKTYTSTVNVKDIPALDHEWSAPEFIWSEDGKTATAIFTCELNNQHKATVDAVVTGEVTTPATEAAEGITTYTATVTFNGTTYTATKDVADVPALDHVWSEPTFTWSEDGKTATVTFTCEYDETHTETVDATITSEVKTEATCEAAGTTTYTATVTFGGTTYVMTNDVEDIAATGHTYGEPSVTWSEDGKTATITFTCESDEHTETVNATVTGEITTPATATEDGTTTYTATAEFDGKTYTFKKDVKDVPATGTPDDSSSTPDDSTSTPDSPDTGDNNHIVFWAALILLSLFGVYAIVVLPRKAFDEGK